MEERRGAIGKETFETDPLETLKFTEFSAEVALGM
jgi:hypothetical protein